MRVSNVPLSSRSVSTSERPSGPLPAPTASMESAARTLLAMRPVARRDASACSRTSTKAR